MKLVVSVVLYQPDLALLQGTLASLTAAISEALDGGLLDSAVVRIADNSLSPLPPATLACLQSLLGELERIGFEYEHTGRNLGFGRAHNLNFARRGGEGDAFLVANPDLRFEQDSIVKGISLLKARPETGLVFPSVSDGRSEWRPACFQYPDVVTLLARALAPRLFERRIRRYECRGEEGGAANGNVRLASGCCMLFRSSAFASIGGFDERYFLYFEDFDLSYRASRSFPSAHCGQMRVIHLGGGASRKGLRHIALFSRSGRIFFSTHGWRWI